MNSGETGSGKTTIRGHMLRQFLSYSATPLSKKIECANFVFDAFTTTKSLTTPSASKSGLMLELQYNTSTSKHATLLGAQYLAHRLERSRLASVPTGERNYHVLYYLLSGTSIATTPVMRLPALAHHSARTRGGDILVTLHS
jgi:chitin synthase